MPQLTVGEAMEEVAVRLGFAAGGTSTIRAQPRIRSFLTQAMRQLAYEADWTDMIRELFIPLVDGQDRYEFPEESEPGQIIDMAIVDTSGCRHSLQGGIQAFQTLPTPSDPTYRVQTGMPLRYNFVDSELQLLPAPNDTFPQLWVRYLMRLPKLTDDDIRLPFDSEVIIQHAVILGKSHYNQPGIDIAAFNAAKYLARIRAQQREGHVFFVGGRKSHFITRDKRVPLGRAQSVGNQAPWDPNWNPW